MTLDIRDYQDPKGYVAGKEYLPTHKLIIENKNENPVLDFTIDVNRRQMRTKADFSRILGNSVTQSSIKRLFSFWTLHKYHQSLGVSRQEYSVPFILNFSGFGYCQEDHGGLSRLLGQFGIATRRPRLSGHTAGEFFVEGKWRLLDGDLNAVYLDWDNETLLNSLDVVMDPLISIRTKGFGRYRRFQWFETTHSLFHFIDPSPGKIIETDDEIAEYEKFRFSLFPGEKLIFNFDLKPERCVVRRDVYDDSSNIGLRIVTQSVSLRERGTRFTFRSAYPIYKILNLSANPVRLTDLDLTILPNQTVTIDRTALFEVKVETKSTDDFIWFISQGTAQSMPYLSKGQNTIYIESTSRVSGLELQYICDSKAFYKEVATPQIYSSEHIFIDRTPHFSVDSPEGATQLWWQISASDDFSFVAPTLDNIQTLSSQIMLDPIEETFLSPHTDYFLRVKAKIDSVWSPWSTAVRFVVDKPASPMVRSRAVTTDSIELVWPDESNDTQYHVFASNAMDFIPMAYWMYRIDSSVNWVRHRLGEEHNLIRVCDTNVVVISMRHMFARIIPERNGHFGNPSPLVRLFLPEMKTDSTYIVNMAANAPISVLQNSHMVYSTTTGVEQTYVATRRFIDIRKLLETSNEVFADSPFLLVEKTDSTIILRADRPGLYIVSLCHNFRKPSGLWEWMLYYARKKKWGLKNYPFGFYDQYYDRFSFVVRVLPKS
jgi:hypothetical protein